MNETTSNWDGLTEAAAALPAGGNRISYEFSYADALEILRLIDTTPNVRKLALSIGDLTIDLERDAADTLERPARMQAAPPAAAPPPPLAQGQITASSDKEAAPAPDGTVSVRSPIAGIFYLAPAPGEPPFVEVGSEVAEDTVVGIIEVMKVMNNIRAGARGVVTGFGAANEDLVQFDQALLYIDPNGQADPS
ncbi:MAG: biotin/lipoyl-containing protein [Hoeflea sp.]|uniref:acetyl-CoA carboxylase biotin carboxyl carrier protein n=1 Tax=Hoeflea sp. TaxID=1940281 RepID=UPI00273154A3|nr:biotin/lipoyl-containing protein [Hoeflea sp.]MDP2118438.1 biotin/lipoyl-containing protein [Hoeflea sp.]